MRRRLLWAATAALALGCGESDGGDASAAPDVPVRPPADAAMDAADAAADAGPPLDGAPDGASTPDAAPPEPDSGPLIREVEDCEDACGVYERCGRLEDLWGGDRDACLEACEDGREAAQWPGYLACLQVEHCDNLQVCRVPQRPPPACEEVCAAIEACEGDFRLPAGLPGIDDCAAACADPAVVRTMQSCGRLLVQADEGEDACDEGAFGRCVLGEREEECLVACERRAACGEPVDPIDCALDCAARAAAEDPVVRRRAEQRRDCIGAAAEGDCETIAACGGPGERPIVGEATVEDLCAANETCGFFDVEACAETVTPLLRGLEEGAVDCFTEHLTDRCEEPPYACFRPAAPPPGACDEHCAVSELCGTLPEGTTRFDCAEGCRQALDSGDPALFDQLLPRLTCAYEADCEAIRSCLEPAEPDDICRHVCEREVSCGARVDAAGCRERCRTRFHTDRVQAERACVLAAADCDGVVRCVPPPAPDCAQICEPLDACGLTNARCALDCDNAHFADPDGFLPRMACLRSTARCDARATCEEGDLTGGDACLAYCRAVVTCNDQADMTLVECVRRCADGMEDAQGVSFEGARACLLEAGPDGACEALQACLVEVEDGAFCDDWCAEIDRCGVSGEMDVEACAADCRERRDEPDVLSRAACTLRAARREEGCRAVADCLGAEVPPASPACTALCEARHACDEGLDAFLCERRCEAEPDGTLVGAACAERATCEQLPACLEAPTEPPAACTAACDEVEACPGLVGEGEDALFADAAACAATCAGAAVVNDETYPDLLQECLAEARAEGCAADAVEACFAQPDDICQASWDAFVSCGLQDILQTDEAGYLAECNRRLAMDPMTTRDQAQCIIDAAAASGGDFFACGLAILQCPGLSP